MALSSILGIGSLGSGILGSIFSSRNQSKLIKLQQQENQLNRDFNAEQAQLSRDFALDMFNRTNEYNSPVNAVNRLRSAGINPALAVSGGSLGSEAASVSPSAAASSSGSISSSPLDYSGIINSPLQAAQVGLIKAETAKTYSEIPWIDQLNSVVKDNYYLDSLTKEYNLKEVLPAERDKVRADIESIGESINKIRADTALTEIAQDNARLEKELRKIDVKYADQTHLANIKSVLSKANLDDKQAYEISYLLGAKLSLLNNQSRAAAASARSSNASAGLQEFDFQLKEAMKALKGVGGIADDQIQIVEGTIRKLHEEASAIRRNAEVNERNAEVNERNSDTQAISVWLGFLSDCLGAFSGS